MASGDPTELYEILQCLGEGTYGEVHRARKRDTGEIVAVKIIPIDEDKSALQQEIDILKNCESPHIVRYYGSYERGSEIWIVMELCEPGSVADVMNMAQVTLDELQIKTICASVLLSLQYLHSNNIIHRDVKAGNILLTKSGKAKIADFGVSAQLSTIQSRRDTAIGAPFWMAPEVIQEEKYDSKVDIWSLGICLIEMGEGRPPHSHLHPMRAIFVIPENPAPTMKKPEKWSREMNNFLSLCLQKSPQQRKTAVELMSHPFVKDSVKALRESEGVSPIILELVQNNIAAVEEYRLNYQHGNSNGTDNTLVSPMQGTLETNQD